MAEVEVDRQSGAVDVKRVVCAQDMGQVVNPQGATLQMEGCITMGMGYALSEEIRCSKGRIEDTSFGTYSLPRRFHVLVHQINVVQIGCLIEGF
jgi:isoquinoline 1-oxidoreductase